MANEKDKNNVSTTSNTDSSSSTVSSTEKTDKTKTELSDSSGQVSLLAVSDNLNPSNSLFFTDPQLWYQEASYTLKLTNPLHYTDSKFKDSIGLMNADKMGNMADWLYTYLVLMEKDQDYLLTTQTNTTSLKTDVSSIKSTANTLNTNINSLNSNLTDFKNKVTDYIDNQGKEETPKTDDDSNLIPIESTWVTTEQFEEYQTDMMQFQYVQSITGILIAVVLILSLGVQLFQIFNKHWRA